MTTSSNRLGKRIVSTLGGESFIEKLVLLVLTALLTTFLIPHLFKRAEAERAQRQAVLQAQMKLLDDAARTILTVHTLALDVSWYKTPQARNTELHNAAVKRYSERLPELISEWRTIVVRARILASMSISAKLDAFLTTVFSHLDTPLSQLIRDSVASDELWVGRHNKSEEMLGRANVLLCELAAEMELTADCVPQREPQH